MKKYDLIVVGAGPAGLSLASELSTSKLKILVLDKKKNAGDVSYNTSGSFIDNTEWNIPSSVFNPIDEVCLCSKNETTRKKIKASIIDRKKLLRFFEEKSRKNENFYIVYRATVEDVECNANEIKHITYSKDSKKIQVTAKIFVDCSGLSAILGKKMEIAPSDPPLGFGVEYLVPLKKRCQCC